MKDRHALGSNAEAIHTQSLSRIEKFDHIEPPFPDFVARHILLRFAKLGRNDLLAPPSFLARSDELIDHPAIAVIVNAPCHTSSHRNDVKIVNCGCVYTNLM